MLNLYELFLKTISIPYLRVGDSSNYATRKDKNTLYIYFEDSKGAEDWKNNLNFPIKAYRNEGNTTVYAHRGFLKVWKQIEPILAPKIFDENVKNIVISGYSHGAALAVLCHEYVYYNRPDVKENLKGFGFGSPRVIWGILSKEIKKRWENFTVIRNIDDIVTHLPPKALGYTHVGTMLEIGEKGKYAPVEAHISKNILTELKIYEETKK